MILPQVETGVWTITSAIQLTSAVKTIGPGQLIDSGTNTLLFLEWEPAFCLDTVVAVYLLSIEIVAALIVNTEVSNKTDRDLNFMANFLFDGKKVTFLG